MIFLHGSGDTGPGVREWLESASAGKFCRRLAELGLGPGVFPTAPARPYTLAGGTPSRVWFDREELFPSSRQDRAGVLQSLQQASWSSRGLKNALEEERIKAHKVFFFTKYGVVKVVWVRE